MLISCRSNSYKHSKFLFHYLCQWNSVVTIIHLIIFTLMWRDDTSLCLVSYLNVFKNIFNTILYYIHCNMYLYANYIQTMIFSLWIDKDPNNCHFHTLHNNSNILENIYFSTDTFSDISWYITNVLSNCILIMFCNIFLKKKTIYWHVVRNVWTHV